MNRWKIPIALEREILKRDLRCIYCGVDVTTPSGVRRDRPSWEHIVNDARIISRENIARCCLGCNASKGRRTLEAWLASSYCHARGITPASVASIARAALEARIFDGQSVVAVCASTADDQKKTPP